MVKKPTYEELEQRVKELEKDSIVHRQIEEALRESEERFRTLIEQSPIAIQVMTPDGRIVQVNDAYVKLWGITLDDLSEFNILQDKQAREIGVMPYIEKAFAGEVSLLPDFQYDAKKTVQKGRNPWIRSHLYPVKDEKGEIQNVVMMYEDLTERKQTEDELAASEEFLNSVVEQSPASLWISDSEGTMIKMNQSCRELFGATDEEAVGKYNLLKDNLIEEQGFMPLVENVFRKGEIARFTIDYDLPSVEHVKVNGATHRILDVIVSPIKDMHGTVTNAIVQHKDITERKRAEEALRESEKKYRRLVENALVGVYQVEEGGKFIMANERMAEIFGYDSAESLISSVDSIANLYARPEERPVVLADIEITGAVYGRDVEFRKKDGEIVWLKLHTRVIREDAKTIYEGLMEDLTESKRAEEERIKLEKKLARSRKMEAMGLMAGGVAHDLNNILSGIVSYPELLLLDLPEDSPLRDPIKTIQESGMRAADVVEDLLTIARGVATGKEALSLNTLTTEYMESAEYKKLEMTHSFVDFKTELDPDLLNMSGSRTHIKKILMNLVANASEAIEGSGMVAISTSNRYLDEPLRGYEDVRIGEYVLLSVSDDGSGISSGDLERIFEPFYTKKVMGRTGTGLGLAVVWNTVQDHNGYININTSEKGTEFQLYLPVTREEVPAEGEEVPLEDYLGHGEKILVVDDEEKQREIASGIVTRLGYTAETVSSGEEAIRYVKTNPVDLILLDMVMPKGINGRKTYEEIIKIRPGQKAIIASGYAKTKEVDLAQELGASKYIKKPYTLSKVGIAVKEELEK